MGKSLLLDTENVTGNIFGAQKWPIQPNWMQANMPQAVAPAGPTTTFFLHLKHCHCKWTENAGILAKVQWVLQGRAWPAVTGCEPRSPLCRPRGYLYFFPSPLCTSFSFTPVEHHPKFPLLRWHKLDPGFPAMCRYLVIVLVHVRRTSMLGASPVSRRRCSTCPALL